MENDCKSSCSMSTSEDLLVEILKRLPVKTLGRFRCVCRSWNSLISSSFFVNLHHSLIPSSTTPPFLKPYLLPTTFKSYVVCHPKEDALVEHLRHDVPFPFRFRGARNGWDRYLVDVIHGVVCVTYCSKSSWDSTVLWNPTIHKYVTLPHLPYPHDFTQEDRFYSCALGFGYDSSKNDFKVVRIWITSYKGGLVYEVYSAREGLWRVATTDVVNLKSYKKDVICGITSCFVNGTIHWLLRDDELALHAVLMFDCEREEFRIMEPAIPIFNLVSTVHGPRLLEHVGMLSAFVGLILEHGFCTELWAMEEHGVATTWRKLYKISSGYGCFYVYQPSCGPNQWSECCVAPNNFFQILHGHVYEESLALMDDDKSHSYIEEEIVYI